MSRVFVLGNATVDLTLRLPAWPRPGETVLATGLARGPGGKGLNQAVAAARAGARVMLCAPVGEDADGAFLREVTAHEPGLDVRWRACSAATDVSTIWVRPDGENMIASSAGCARAVAAAEMDDLLRDLAAGDLLQVQGNLTLEATLEACRRARAASATVLVNTAPIDWPMAPLIALADVTICNRPEAEAIAGRPGEAAAYEVARRSGGVALMTLGAEGAILVENGKAVRIATPRVAATDASGAGDVASGYLAAMLAEGRALCEAARIAVRAASLSVTRPGTLAACPSRAEVFSLAAACAP